MSSECPLPPVRRVVTSHDDKGVARVWIDDIVERKRVPGTKDAVTFELAWVTNEHPAEVQKEVDGATLPIGELTNENGSVLRYVDFPPAHESPMHRTTSIDYGFVCFGEVVLVLPDGSRTTVKQGEVVIQRGTDHQWLNASETEWARMAYVLLPSKPVMIDGKALPDKSIH